MNTKTRKSKAVINCLQSSEGKILSYLKKIIIGKVFNYRTFGTAIEEHLTAVIIKILADEGFIEQDTDYVISPNKNHFPDLELRAEPTLAIEFKSGNRSQYRKGKWIAVKNSENDMGTLNEWPKKIRNFGGDNIFYIFVIYNFNDHIKEVLSVEILPFYKFIGFNKKGMLKYREKDGNLRPKDFNIDPPIKSLKQFENLFKKTVVYRSKRIIKRHRLIIKKLL